MIDGFYSYQFLDNLNSRRNVPTKIDTIRSMKFLCSVWLLQPNFGRNTDNSRIDNRIDNHKRKH